MTAPTTPAAASQQLWQCLLAGDTDAAAALIDDAAVFVHMGATLDKQQELDALRNQWIVLKNRELQETSARIIGATGIVLNKIRLTAAVKGQEVENPFVVTESYVSNGQGWLLAAMSYTWIVY